MSLVYKGDSSAIIRYRRIDMLIYKPSMTGIIENRKLVLLQVNQPRSHDMTTEIFIADQVVITACDECYDGI